MQYTYTGSGARSPTDQGIGFWSVDLRTGTVTWDNTTAAIHGMPPGYTPALHEALGFFPSADRARVIQSALAAFDARTLFDIEASIEVRGGIRVRLIGGRGYDARGGGAELHGIIEPLPFAAQLAGNADESASCLSIAALLHELRARIASISIVSTDIEGEPDAPARVRERMGRIAREAAQMQRIIDGVASLQRNEPPRRERIDASRMAECILKAHVDRMPDYSRALVTIESGIELDGDPPEVELLLDNLIENALKFSAGQSQPRVQLTATQEQGRTLVHVSDNGAGFAPGDAVRIFQLFTHRCAPEFEGTGVGLAIAKRVVERHGGLIWAEGVPGQGATFSFYL
jgi:signal transduction histidine kinase